jgi:hypothetical protein
MIESIQQNSGQIIIPLLCFCLPGLLFILNGIRTIRNKETVSTGTDSHFRWKKPIFLKGEKAVKDGKWDVVFGVLLLLIGVIALIGIFS